IRDRNVTGVQTCALPIFGRDRAGDGPGATSSLLSNIVASLAGSDETNSSPAVQDKLNDLYEQAATNLADLITDPSTELFPGRPLGSSDGNLETTYQKLYEIAVATARSEERRVGKEGRSGRAREAGTEEEVIKRSGKMRMIVN